MDNVWLVEEIVYYKIFYSLFTLIQTEKDTV